MTLNKSKTMKIGLLLCDDVDESYRDQYGTYATMFQNALDPTRETFDLTPIHCHLGEALPSPDSFEAYVISGSKYGVYEDFPWIHDLQEFVRQCWQQDIKMAGICFGHQLIAHSLGGLAKKADVGWGFGIHSAKLTRPQSWMDNLDRLKSNQYNLIVIHQDQVVELPQGFRTIGENDFCPNSMILADNKMLGVQGHPEFSKAYCQLRAQARRSLIGEEVYQATLASLESHDLNADIVLGWIRRFLQPQSS